MLKEVKACGLCPKLVKISRDAFKAEQNGQGAAPAPLAADQPRESKGRRTLIASRGLQVTAPQGPQTPYGWPAAQEVPQVAQGLTPPFTPASQELPPAVEQEPREESYIDMARDALQEAIPFKFGPGGA